MYSDLEQGMLTRATVRLLRKSVSDIRKDKTKLSSVLLMLQRFSMESFNNPEKTKSLCVLILSSMWETFRVELMK